MWTLTLRLKCLKKVAYVSGDGVTTATTLLIVTKLFNQNLLFGGKKQLSVIPSNRPGYDWDPEYPFLAMSAITKSSV